MKIAIVTGASSGIGREFVHYIDKKEEFNEIWVIARREERLLQLQQSCHTAIRPITMDLTKTENLEKLKTMLKERAPKVELLVNASGFGKLGTYADLTLSETNNMIDLNCKAAVDLTIIAIPYMPKGSRILQICSSAAFQPLPGLNIYAASKAFLLSFTRALRWELAGRSIKVTAVCPGWVKTEFIDVAKSTKNGGTVKHFPFAVTPQFVVSCAMADNSLNLPVATCGPTAAVHRILAKFLPTSLVIAAWEGIRRI